MALLMRVLRSKPLFNLTQAACNLVKNNTNLNRIAPQFTGGIFRETNPRNFSSLINYTQIAQNNINKSSCLKLKISNFLQPSSFPCQDQQRNLTKFSLRKGKRKTVKAVIRRFYRLDWGIWIRTRAGKHKHLWKKHKRRKQRLLKHFFCNNQQSRLLNHMVSKFWKKKRHYFDDPYEPYQTRYNIYRGNMKESGQVTSTKGGKVAKIESDF